jgi:hypothetical protein
VSFNVIDFSWNVCVSLLVLLCRLQELLCLNMCTGNGQPGKFFRGFRQALEAVAEILPENRLRLLPSTSFSLSYHSTLYDLHN